MKSEYQKAAEVLRQCVKADGALQGFIEDPKRLCGAILDGNIDRVVSAQICNVLESANAKDLLRLFVNGTEYAVVYKKQKELLAAYWMMSEENAETIQQVLWYMVGWDYPKKPNPNPQPNPGPRPNPNPQPNPGTRPNPNPQPKLGPRPGTAPNATVSTFILAVAAHVLLAEIFSAIAPLYDLGPTLAVGAIIGTLVYFWFGRDGRKGVLGSYMGFMTADMICFVLLEMMIFDIQSFGLDTALCSGSFQGLFGLLSLVLIVYAVCHQSGAGSSVR